MNMLSYKFKQLFKRFLTVSRLHHIAWRFIPNGVYVFNYHRIGDRNTCEFDREVFSCTAQAFEEHCSFIKSYFEVVSLEQLELIIKENRHLEKRYAVFTFDDGYIDNYTVAYPILRKHNISASFYVATDFVGSKLIPWWDEIAFILRHSQGSTYQLPNSSTKYFLIENDLEAVISRIIYDAKRLETVTVLDVLDDIRNFFPEISIKLKESKQQLFMNWEQLMEMTSNGMTIGSHTLSHQMLSQLTLIDQKFELEQSKKIIEEKLLSPVDSVVYPVGRRHCYTKETCKLAENAGYKFGFNNEPGRIIDTCTIYDLNRYCIGSNSIDELKINVLFHL